MKISAFTRFVLVLVALSLLPASVRISAHAANIRQAYYMTRINDKSIPPPQRIAYMDSLLHEEPANIEIRKMKSDLCFKTGDYAGAAIEYMALAERFGEQLGIHNRLRAMTYAARSLYFCGQPVEAAAICLEALMLPKPDSLLYMNAMTREMIINTALTSQDIKGAERYIRQQQDIASLRNRGVIPGEMSNSLVSTLNSHLCDYYILKGDYQAALNAAQTALSMSRLHHDSAYVNMQIASIYSKLGDDEAALTLYKRNLPISEDPWSDRDFNNGYADLLIKNARYADALAQLGRFDADSLADMLEVRRLKLKADAMWHLDNPIGAYASLRAASRMQDSLAGRNDMLGTALREFEGSIAQGRYEKEKSRGDRWRNILFALVGVILLSAGCATALSWIRKRRQSRVVNTNSASDSDESRQLLSTTMQLTRMAETIKNVGELAADDAPDALEKIASEIRALNYSSNTWELFRNSFENMHPGFFAALTRDCPGMSIGEQRMAAYIILGLTNKEIASMINRQPRTVETIKYRLRKSLEIPSDIQTSEWLKRYLPVREATFKP